MALFSLQIMALALFCYINIVSHEINLLSKITSPSHADMREKKINIAGKYTYISMQTGRICRKN